MPETSIVVRSFNEAEHIGDVLEAISEQSYQDFEIILVDSGSTDGTLEIADQYVDKVEFVAPHDFTFGHSCNAGCKVADGEFVSFLSAHAIPTDDRWLGSMVKKFDDEEVAMTYSNQIGAEQNKFSERRLFNELFGEEPKRQTPPDYFANNASSVIRKKLWEEHPFDEYLTGHEDIEWAKQFMDQGYVVVYDPDACIYHIHDETWTQVYNRFKREAAADVEIGIKGESDRWHEYKKIPLDILGDVVAAVRGGQFDIQTLVEIGRFRYCQHMGTVDGLTTDRELNSDRFEYFYPEANERVIVDEQGTTTLEQAPLPEIKPNDVLVRTDYIGVSPADSSLEGTNIEQYPVVPGRNYVGTVIDIGANVKSVEIGDVVVGDTEFDCGICTACSGGSDTDCLDPIKLGQDTDDGAYSRFLAIPSDHVYSLDTEPKDGALAGMVGRLRKGIDRAGKLLSPSAHCIVVGDNPAAEVVVQLLHREGYSVDHLDQLPVNRSSSTGLLEYDLIVDTTGSQETVRTLCEQTASSAVLLLLAAQYDPLPLASDLLASKTIINVDTDDTAEMGGTIQLLSEIETDRLFDGTYSLGEYEAAWEAATDQQGFPVISIDNDLDSGSVRTKQ
ncbi:glycosyltransferase [Halorubrum pallidum]|uniref:Glycosyltransferase n=1 Tax=Halorubrum pallidum TaxID=1526114 RepID=A0ABD5T126_9EURY